MDVNGKAYHKIAKSFPEAVQVTGIDRAKLGRDVFGNPERLKQLENILHPLVREARQVYQATKSLQVKINNIRCAALIRNRG